ncbi:MAG: WD40 repeat domain-containing protein [Candidatus Thorarchaeota archaeon]
MKLREVANVPLSAEGYSVYLRQRPDGYAQVFALDYADQLSVYDVSGNLKTSKRYSSRVRCIAVADIEGNGSDALVGGIGKNVLVVDQRGRTVWSIALESDVIACDARDVDGDGSAEVAVALDNRRVILWNDDRTALFSRSMQDPVADVWLEDMTPDDGELEVIVADRKGLVTVVSTAGYKLREFRLGDRLTVFAVLTFGDRKLLITGDDSSVLKIWDLEGRAVGTVQLRDRPRAVATGTPNNVSDLAYVVVATSDRRLSFWTVHDTDQPTKTERVVLNEIMSTKQILYRRAIKCGNCGAPTTPESPRCESCGAVLEMLSEYAVEQYLRESIDSITSKHSRIELKDLDRILRRTLPRPVPYNLRRTLQKMIQIRALDGHIEGNTFIRTPKTRPIDKLGPTVSEIQQVRRVLTDLLRNRRTVEILKLEQQTGVPREILRRTLIILLGEEAVRGTLSENTFELDDRQNREEFVRRLEQELVALTV